MYLAENFNKLKKKDPSFPGVGPCLPCLICEQLCFKVQSLTQWASTRDDAQKTHFTAL